MFQPTKKYTVVNIKDLLIRFDGTPYRDPGIYIVIPGAPCTQSPCSQSETFHGIDIQTHKDIYYGHHYVLDRSDNLEELLQKYFLDLL